MALDAQSNWNAEMAQSSTASPIVLPHRLSTAQSPQELAMTSAFPEIHLPAEIICQIVSYLPHRASDQKSLWACCLVSRAWYAATVPLLYDRPYIRGGNFHAFVATVCPSKNAHVRRSPLAGFVKVLDMGELVHDGSRSLTARLLGRLKGNVVEFVAPQASFSINSFAALSKCRNLNILNLSLTSASISTDRLFQTLQSLVHLEILYYPRTYMQLNEGVREPYIWPSTLKSLHFGGGIDDFFLLLHVCNVPRILERLSIQLCPQIYSSALQITLEKIGPQLRHLTIRHPMANLAWSVLDKTLIWCPDLIALRISADFISDRFFERSGIRQGHSLQILDLDCSDLTGPNVGIHPDSLWEAVDEGRLPNLRSVRVNARLAWLATPGRRSSSTDLADLLEEQEKDNPLGVKTGVWTYIS